MSWRFCRENPLPWDFVRSAESRRRSSSPYPARSLPPCSCSTILRPISQYAAVRIALTARAEDRLASATNAPIPDTSSS